MLKTNSAFSTVCQMAAFSPRLMSCARISRACSLGKPLGAAKGRSGASRLRRFVRAVEGVFVFDGQRSPCRAAQDFPLAVAVVVFGAVFGEFAVLVGVVDAGEGVGEVGDALEAGLRRFPVDFPGLVAIKRQAAAVGEAHAAPVVNQPGIRRGEVGALFEQALQFRRFEVAEVGEGFGAVGVGFFVHQWFEPLQVGGEGVVQAGQGQGFHALVSGSGAGSAMWMRSMRRLFFGSQLPL